MESNNVETKKPFYKKWWFIAVAIILAITVFNTIKGNIKAKIDWEEIELGEFIPMPEKAKGEIKSNQRNEARIDIKDLTEKEYIDYVKKCISKGYDVDITNEDWDTIYEAFNKEGYNIYISYSKYKKEMSVTLKAPKTQKMKEIVWPTNGLGAILPTPKSNLGEIISNSSKYFTIDIGNITKEDYDMYVKACEDIGFTVDYSKSEKYFSAKNAEEYKVSVEYLGANVIRISLNAPKEQTETIIPDETETTVPEPPKTETTKPVETPSSNKDELSKDFKAAMDSYETFMNEYVEFMKKYNNNPTDFSLISQYATMLQKYSEQVSNFDKWESKNLTTKEVAYYVDVQARVSKKILEITE